MTPIQKTGWLLLVLANIIALVVGGTKSVRRKSTPAPPPSHVVMDLGDGWYSASEYTRPSELKTWEQERGDAGQRCWYFGNYYTTSPPIRQNVYRCLDQAMPARETTVP